MAAFWRFFLLALPLQQLSLAATLPSTKGSSVYAPKAVNCPSKPLVRLANRMGDEEFDYVFLRKPATETPLITWLQHVSPDFPTSNMPKLALATSGEGFRGMLCGAGVVKAFDSREGTSSTAGLYQAMTYHSGNSGGAWLVESMAGSGWPTISSLLKTWIPALSKSILESSFSLSDAGLATISNDLASKAMAGFPLDLVDAWGRLLSYMLFSGVDGSVSATLSGTTASTDWTSHKVPFPIVTALGSDTDGGMCDASTRVTQYEFTPYEFGSWDDGVEAFTPTKYLGSLLSNGMPRNSSSCVQGFDSIGWVLGTAGNFFNSSACSDLASSSKGSPSLLQSLLASAKGKRAPRVGFSSLVNPFFNNEASPHVAHQPRLSLADGSEFDVTRKSRADPIWPLIQPERGVDVIIVSDASGDTEDNWPDGQSLRQTLAQSQAQSVGRMPDIPSADVFTTHGLNKKPTFFGCHTKDTVTIIWLPNSYQSFATNSTATQDTFTDAQTADIIDNGVQVANNGGDATWALCLGCGIVAKSAANSGLEGGTGPLPKDCKTCFEEYCYN